MRRAKAHSFIICGGLILMSCAAVGPNYQPPALNVPAAWNRLDPATQPVTTTAAPRGLGLWWRGLNDPLLSELIDEAQVTSPDLRIAGARLREARARRSVAASGRYPSVTASGSALRGDLTGSAGNDNTTNLGGANLGSSHSFYSVGLDASWELDVFGGVRRGAEAAEADLESSRESLRHTQVTLVSEVALNYVDVRALQIRLQIARDNLATQIATLQLTGWRAQAGLVNSQDVEQARSNMEQTRAQIPSLEISRAEAEHILEILLGKPPGALHARLTAEGAFPTPQTEVAVGIPANTLRQRPDIQAAERTLAAETARIGVAKAALYPSFNLSGSIGLEALTLGALGDGGTRSLLAGVTAPLFNAGRLRGEVKIQDAVRERALVTYEQSVLAALQEVENALVALARNRERGEALTRAAGAARNAALLARQRYGAGLIDFQSVLDTERSVLTVEDNLASTRADNVLALIRLYKALGGGWSPQASVGPASKETP